MFYDSRDQKRRLTWTVTDYDVGPESIGTDVWKSDVGNMHKLSVNHALYDLPPFPPKEDARYLTWSGSEEVVHSPPSGSPNAQRLAPSKEIDDIWSQKHERRRYSPEDIHTKSLSELGFTEETIKKYGIEKSRHFLMLSAFRELQIPRTLSYFSQHTELLETTDGQWLMEHLIFEPLILREALTQDAAQVKLLLTSFQSLIHQQYEQVRVGMSESQVVFLVRLHRRFQQEVDHIHTKDPNIISKEVRQLLPDVKEKISGLLQFGSISDELHMVLNQELAISYAYVDTWDDDSLAQFLIAHIAASVSPWPVHLVDKFSSVEQEEAFNLQLKKINEHFEKMASYGSLLNKVVKASIPNMPTDVNWRPYNAFPVFRGIAKESNKQYYVDLLSGRIWDDTGSLSSLPTFIATYPAVAALRTKFPDAAITSPDIDQWYLTSSTGEEYRITEGRQVPIIQKKIDNDWYQLDESQKLSIPALTRGKNHWIFKDQEGNSKISIEDASSGKVFAYGTFNSGDEGFKIYKTGNAGKPTTWIFEDVGQPESQMHFLTDIESASEILFWRDQTTGNPKEVTLPRLGLQFEVHEKEGKFVFISDQLGGYAIAENQGANALADAMHYLVLEKGKEKQVLIPRIPYAALDETASSLHPVSKLDNSAGSNYPYFIYHVQPSKSKMSGKSQVTALDESSPTSMQTQLLPPDREASLFLSMIHLWHHNYEETLKFLVGHGGQQERYGSNEREILKWVSRLDQGNKDATPEAVAVRLQAHILLMRNERNFGFKKQGPNEKSVFEDVDFLREAFLTYEKYLSHTSPWGQFQLQQDDENFFLREFLSLYPKHAFIELVKEKFTGEIAESLYQFLLNQRLSLLKGQPTLSPDVSVTKPHPGSPSLREFEWFNYYSSNMIADDLQSHRDRESSGDILKPIFGKEIPEFYRAVRTHDPSLMRTMLQKITRTDFFNSLNTEKELTSALDQVLEFISTRPKDESISRSDYDKVSNIAKFLRNVLQYPISASSPLPEELIIDGDSTPLKNEIKIIFGLIEDVQKARDAQKSESMSVFEGFDLSRIWKSYWPTQPARQGFVVPRESRSATPEKAQPDLVLTIPQISGLVEFHVDPESAGNLMSLNSPASLNATREELAKDMDLVTNNTVANRVINKLHEEISHYEGPAKAQSYSITDWPALQELHQALSQEYAASGILLDSLTKQIETLIQKEPSDSTERAHRRLEVAIKRKNLLTINDAIYLYLRHSSQTFQELNPALDEADQNPEFPKKL